MDLSWFRRRPQQLRPALHANKALERAEALIHFGSWHWDPILNRTEWSIELHRIYGVEPGTFEGTLDGYLSRVHPDDRSTVEKTVRDAMQARRGFVMRERVVRPDGEIRTLSTAGDVELDEHGNVTGMFGACHDITEQERAGELRRQAEDKRLALEQQFFQSQKLEAVGRLAGGIAHDFNNMLHVIIGGAAMLLEGKGEQHADWNDLRAIEDAAERARGLTQQLLAVARRQTLATIEIDANDAVRDIEDLLRRSLGVDVQFTLTLAPGQLVVKADPGQLQQVLLNLVVNARDAMPEGGTLTLTTRLAVEAGGAEFVVIEVRDTGIGMDAATLAHTFEPFFTTKGPSGTGLGLATVYGIVTQSGGRVDVTSTPGQGSVFSVRLPRLRVAPAASSSAHLGPADGGTETVLVVDDAEPVLGLTSRILERAGYQVLTAPNAAWAVSVSERHSGRVDLLLTDVMMPGQSGPQLAARLTGMRPRLRVLYMTGYQRTGPNGETVVPVEAHLLEKPFKPEALLRAVRQALDEA